MTPTGTTELINVFSVTPTVTTELINVFSVTPTVTTEIKNVFSVTPTVATELINAFSVTPTVTTELTNILEDPDVSALWSYVVEETGVPGETTLPHAGKRSFYPCIIQVLYFDRQIFNI